MKVRDVACDLGVDTLIRTLFDIWYQTRTPRRAFQVLTVRWARCSDHPAPAELPELLPKETK
jgi:hypothetical protein